MITPIELNSKIFNKAGYGYEKKDVDNFMREVSTNYETLYKENVELKDRVNALNDGIQYYKTIEKTIQKALVLAEQTAEETKETARQNAKSIEDNAQIKASMILEDAKHQLNDIHQKTIRMIEQYELYKTQFKHLASAQMELLNSDSFQIHVANLEAFLPKETREDLVSEQTKQKSDTGSSSESDVTASEETLDILPIENI